MCFIKKGTNGRTLAPLAAAYASADWCRSLGVAYTIDLPPPPIFEREKDAFICDSSSARGEQTC